MPQVWGAEALPAMHGPFSAAPRRTRAKQRGGFGFADAAYDVGPVVA